MKMNYTKIILDVLIAIAFALLMNPRVLGGLPFHEIGGLVIAVVFLIHIGLNYRWVITTTKNIFSKNLPTKARLNFILNILLLISMVVVTISGILISRVVFPGLAILGSHFIRSIHGLSADLTVGLVGLHIGLHWQWVRITCKRAFKSEEGKLKKGVVAAVVLALAILAGGIQWFSSTATTNNNYFPPKQIQQSADGQPFNKGDQGSFNEGFQGEPPNGDFRGEAANGEFHGKGGRGGSSNPFLVIFNYFAIWAVIVISTYYLEKRTLRNKGNQQFPKVSYDL